MHRKHKDNYRHQWINDVKRNNHCYSENKSSQKFYGQNTVLLNTTAKATYSKESTFKSLTPRAVFEAEALGDAF